MQLLVWGGGCELRTLSGVGLAYSSTRTRRNPWAMNKHGRGVLAQVLLRAAHRNKSRVSGLSATMRLNLSLQQQSPTFASRRPSASARTHCAARRRSDPSPPLLLDNLGDRGPFTGVRRGLKQLVDGLFGACRRRASCQVMRPLPGHTPAHESGRLTGSRPRPHLHSGCLCTQWRPGDSLRPDLRHTGRYHRRRKDRKRIYRATYSRVNDRRILSAFRAGAF